MEEIGRRLRAARVDARLTQAEVAKDFLVRRQTISSWERGHSMPSVLQLRELAVLYGVSVDSVLFGVDSAPDAAKDALEKIRHPSQ